MARTTTMTVRLSGALSDFVAANVGEDGSYAETGRASGTAVLSLSAPFPVDLCPVDLLEGFSADGEGEEPVDG